MCKSTPRIVTEVIPVFSLTILLGEMVRFLRSRIRLSPNMELQTEFGSICIEICCLTPRWSQRRLRLEFMDSLSYTTVIEFAEPLARRRGSALDR